MKNKFEFEQQIFNCWHIVDDLQALFEDVCETEKPDGDQIANILIGLKQLYDIKFRKLMDMFEDE